MDELRICTWCNEEFKPHTWHQKYCKAECRIQALFPPAPPRTCKTCGEEFKGHGNQIFCKRECNPRHAPKPPKPLIDHSRPCSDCGASWTPADPYRTKATKCVACRDRDAEEHVYSNTKGWRNAVRNRADNRCEECDKTAQEAGGPLHAHHIVPRADGGANTLANGRLLCVACHDAAHGGIGLVSGTSFAPQGEAINQIAQRVAELMSADLARIEARVASIEELAQRY